jgi:hypothetical protein
VLGDCSENNDVFSNQFEWSRHMKIKHGIKDTELSCPLCCEVIKGVNVILLDHMRSHLEEIALAALPLDIESTESDFGTDSKDFESQPRCQEDTLGVELPKPLDRGKSNLDISNSADNLHPRGEVIKLSTSEILNHEDDANTRLAAPHAITNASVPAESTPIKKKLSLSDYTKSRMQLPRTHHISVASAKDIHSPPPVETILIKKKISLSDYTKSRTQLPRTHHISTASGKDTQIPPPVETIPIKSSCSKAEVIKSGLARPQRRHIEEAPLPTASESQEGSHTISKPIRPYENIHKVISAFQCGNCNKNFTRKDNLRKHQRMKHGPLQYVRK